MLGSLFKKEHNLDVTYVWVPHSLGIVKKRNLSPEAWKDLRIPNRINFETEILDGIDFVAATSSIIKNSAADDYGYPGEFLWLPPCIDQDRYYPRQIGSTDPIWTLLSNLTNFPVEEIQSKKIITEISRTDKTKQKDVLIRAFARVLEDHPDSLLVISIDHTNGELAEELMALIESCGIKNSTAAVGSIWNELPVLYVIIDIYCTPSVMEGFGMSVQEAAATKIPVVSSDLVPFVTEYLAKKTSPKIMLESGTDDNKWRRSYYCPPRGSGKLCLCY